MTNLDVIKHLAATNPTRLSMFIYDIYCMGWNCGAYCQATDGGVLEECDIGDFEEWLEQEPSSKLFSDDELEECAAAIKNKNSATI